MFARFWQGFAWGHSNHLLSSDASTGHAALLNAWSYCKLLRLQVKHELKLHAAGVTGVPHFVINGRYHLSGAQDTSTFVEVLSQL